MSLGLPSSSNQPSGASNLASLFSTLNRGQNAGRAGALGATRHRIDQTYNQLNKGLDWASTLRDTQTQLRESSRPKAIATEPTASRTKDRASSSDVDRQVDQTGDRASDHASDRTTDSQAAAVRDARHNDSRQDAKQDTRLDASSTDVDQQDYDAVDRLTGDRSNNTLETDDTDTLDGNASALDAPADDNAPADDGDTNSSDDSEDQAIQAAYAQTILAPLTGNQPVVTTPAAQETQTASSQATNVQAQNQAQGQSQSGQLIAQQQTGEAAAIGQASAEVGQVIQGQTPGKSQGQGALPAQANQAANAQAQNNPNALVSAEASSSQNPQHSQQQNHAGQQGSGGSAGQSHQAAAAPGSAHAAPVIEIQTTPGNPSSAANQAAGGVSAPSTGTSAAQAAITLPPGADALLNAQGQDDTDPNVTRIANGLRSAVNLKGGAVTIRLNPHELGSVRIEMEIKNGNVTAQLQTEHASVRDLLNHQLGKLRESLQGRGLHVERLEVNSPAPADDSSAGRHAQESPDQGRSRGQFFQQRGGSNGSDGSDGQQRGQSLAERKNFGDMLVDMVG